MTVSQKMLRWGLPLVPLMLCHCSVLLRESVEGGRAFPDGSLGDTTSGDGGASADALGPSNADGDADEDDTDRLPPGACGNDALEDDEECDADSAFCNGCKLEPLPGGFACWSEDNETRYFFHVPGGDLERTWEQSRTECENGLQGHLEGLPYSYYGLAALWDSTVYSCVTAYFDGIEGRENFHVGLRKDEDGSWEWIYRNSAGEENGEPFGDIGAFSPQPYLDHELDHDCASFHRDPGNENWDYWHLDEDPCDDLSDGSAQPLCMVAF
jgi:hypothetical protein